MNVSKKTAVAVCIVMSVFLLVGTAFAAKPKGTAEKEEGVYTIGMIVKNLGNPFFEACERGAKEAAAELGDKIIFTGPDVPTAEGQIALIDSFIAQRVDVIAPVANDPDALIPVCNKARNAGINVVAWNSPMTSEGVDIYVDNPKNRSADARRFD